MRLDESFSYVVSNPSQPSQSCGKLSFVCVHTRCPIQLYPVSLRRDSIASMALDLLPPACLARQGDSKLGRSGWTTDQWIRRSAGGAGATGKVVVRHTGV